mmetsp:Transcript_45589/g.83477  ORF Transcript_45589/g.83477 Transcript_45589/m.83477 type:complete len:198 (+) Transcript_45589:88-681(+)
MALSRSTALVTVAASAFIMAMFNPMSFVEPGVAPSARGQDASASQQQDRFRPFTTAPEAPVAQGHASSVAGVVAMAATLGLALGLVATPVYAEDEATEGGTRAARKARREAARKAAEAEAKAAKSESSGSSFSLPSLPALPNPFAGGDVVASKQAAPVVDADDRSPVASDPVALFLIFFTVPSIYLVFYVLGSVDVI